LTHSGTSTREVRGAAVHGVHAGQPGRREIAEHRLGPVEPRLVGQARQRVGHAEERGELAQLARRAPVADDDLRGLAAEVLRARDPRPLEQAGGREVRVEVEEDREGRAAGQVLQDPPVHALACEQRVVDGPRPDDPVGADAVALGPQERAQRLGVGDPARIGALRDLRSPQRVQVAVDEPRHDGRAAAVEHLRARVAGVPHLGVVAHGDDDAVAHRDGRRPRPAGVQRADAGAQEREVGGHRREDRPTGAAGAAGRRGPPSPRP
jgi:hypothetical protein